MNPVSMTDETPLPMPAGHDPVPDNRPDIHQEGPKARIEALRALLDVIPAGDGVHFRGARKRGGIGRIFGGEVIGQALSAAMKTVPADRPVHSLHAYFLRGGSEELDTNYRVEADFDGGSFSNRRVIATQQDKIIFNLAASFHRREAGHHHQTAMPDVPMPETLATVQELAGQFADRGQLDEIARHVLLRPSPLEVRPLAPPRFANGLLQLRLGGFWFRAVSPLGDDRRLHTIVLGYASDMGPAGAVFAAHPIIPDVKTASLDHNLWFHGDIRADDWLLFHLESPWSGGARGLGTGRIFDRTGKLVATVAQELMIRDPALSDS